MQEAYIVAGFRTAVAKSKRGGFRFYRPDDLAVDVIKGLMASVPQLEAKRVDDVIVGNAVPEAEQGLQVGSQNADEKPCMMSQQLQISRTMHFPPHVVQLV